MKKAYESMEKATSVFTDRYGRVPTETEITNLYHEYRNNWKHYDGFLDWLINTDR